MIDFFDVLDCMFPAFFRPAGVSSPKACLGALRMKLSEVKIILNKE